MPFKAVFDSPSFYSNPLGFYSCGGSPELSKALIKYLDENKGSLSEVHIALYLFNNFEIHKKLVSLSQQGVEVKVYTIPLEGYDDANPQVIIGLPNKKKVAYSTKFQLARTLFKDYFLSSYENYTIHFFPHIYIRSPKIKPFSRGEMPFSLHTKSFLFRHKNGNYDLAISSSNFVVRDLIKEENLLFIFNEIAFQEAVINFFKVLNEYSTPLLSYEFKEPDLNIPIIPKHVALKKNGGFMAPFYFDSPFKIEDLLKHLVRSAKERIIIVGQHVCPVGFKITPSFHSAYEAINHYRSSLADVLIEKANANIPVQILSQTIGNGKFKQGKNLSNPVNNYSFNKFFGRIQKCRNIKYYVNKNCHSKYIIVDNVVFISTFNYTPSQFIFLDKVNIENFENKHTKPYKGIYSEVGQFVVVDNPEIVSQYFDNFNGIKNNCATECIK